MRTGGRLARGGLTGADKWQQCILWDFPEGYRLYEHIKSKANGETKPVKNHSGGGHDRQDAYLYGYPKGPKKRFRSPVEFFPHLLWLSTDESSDHQNCTCRICCPMQLESEKPALPLKPEIRPDPAMAGLKKENSPNTTVQAPTPVGRNPSAQVPVRRPSTGTPAQSPSVKPATPSSAANPQRIKPPAILEPTPLPQLRSVDQQVDHQYGKFLARTGEVVWFFRPKTEAWGLGLVIRRWVPKDRSSDRAYLVQPLSHPYNSPTAELVTSDQNLKPWLAWSAPSCTYPYLQQNPTLSYDQVDWRALLSGQFGQGIADVDASILAAKAIDTTFTPFELLKTTINTGMEERRWNGVYLGAEKIWRGEPVRLRIGSGNDLMVITDIIERAVPGPPPNQTNSAHPLSKILVLGDIYTYATLPVPDPNSLPQVPSSSNIPIRMREDMRWRNRALVPATRTLAYWKLIATSQKLEISEIKGRWYESSVLFVDFFTKAVKNNEGGNGVWMNSRGDATGLGKAAGVLQPDRISAFRTAVPKGLHLVEGLDVPDEPSKPPTSEMQSLELGIGAASGDSGFALDDFMNLDGMDDGGIAFGDDFTF